ncbi:MAG: hypothetical protein Ct9H300mP23_07180 [Nitrospinota bacterium]|nr:MAG: hypothetical protein Ct9H300mP23_07180 [Nitrospinota bacterium]
MHRESLNDGIYNAVSPNAVRNKEFTKTLGKILNVQPFSRAKICFKGRIGELSELLLGSQRVNANKISDTGFKFKYPHIQEALKEVCGNTYHEIKTEQWVPQPVERTFSFLRKPEI